uniref:Uncharacterized protein n=1 Tax=Meloidogyne hapla TaxID=6305 RepID=A0A1I8BP05_MELHA
MKHFLPLIIILIITLKNASCEYVHHINKALRLQVENFLLDNLTTGYNRRAGRYGFKKLNIEDLHHLFQGLSLFNDHYRFGGILDYCSEIGMVSILEGLKKWTLGQDF